ncbi:MAG: M56 family metallopeptidase [Gammaproteobacteria bacterium]|nr:M56 family metallopeptidase [Pseudomonadales bacterium]MCP5348140.1 M56 family metallopeptidase [Pseudomonadales bacterium]
MTTLLTSLDLIQAEIPAFYFWLDSVVKASLLVMVAALFSWLYRGQSASSHSLIWLTALMGCLAIPLFKLVIPAIDILIPVSGTEAAGGLESTFQVLFSADPGGGDRLLTVLGLPVWIYLGGVLSMSLFLATGVLHLTVISRRATPYPGHRANSILIELLHDNGSRNRVRLLFSHSTPTPFTWGIVEHRLILPCAARDWDPELLRQAIAHELGHIERNDWVARLLGRLALCLYWPNPLIWFAARRLKLASEQACDDAAIDSCHSEVTYASNLLQVAGGLQRKAVSPLAVALFSRTSELTLRIQHILKADHNREFLRADEIGTATLLTLLLVIPLSVLDVSAQTMAPVIHSRMVIPVTMDAPENAQIAESGQPGSTMAAPQYFETNARPSLEPVNLNPDAFAGRHSDHTSSSSIQISDSQFRLPQESLFRNWEAAPLLVRTPTYPLRALHKGIEGHVVAEFRIGEDGKVTDTTIIESVPTGVFDNAVLRAVEQFIYYPEVVAGIGGNNQPVRKRFQFALENSN